MRKQAKRILALLLALVLAAALGCSALAEDAILVYKLGERQFLGLNRLTGVLVNATQSLPSHLVIPSEILGYKVTAIADKLFYGRDDLVSVTVPGTVETIGDEAFSSCLSLQSVTLQEGVRSLGKSAFRYCYSLREVSLPTTLTSLESDTFESCLALESVTVPEGVATLGDRVFANCTSLRTARLPQSLLSTGEYVFNGCSALESMALPGKLQSLSTAVFNGCSALKSVTVPSSVKIIGKSAFGECASLQTLILPEGVVSIEDWAFNGCTGLTALSVPTTVEQISGDAFYGCNDVVFYVKAGSYAQVFASANNRPFVTKPLDPGTLPDDPGTKPDDPGTKPDNKPGDYPETPFVDDKTSGLAWARPYIRWAYAMGYIAGTTDTTFSPKSSITRGMLVTLLYNMEGQPETGAATFSDLTLDYYKKPVAWAQQTGLVSGVGNNRFKPGEPVTREQFVAILYRYAAYKKKDTSQRGDLTRFRDSSRVMSFAVTPMTWAVGAGVVTGKENSRLDPKGSATRAEAAVMLYKFTTLP